MYDFLPEGSVPPHSCKPQLTNHASTYAWSRRAHSNQLPAEHLYLRVQKAFHSYHFQSGNHPPLSSQTCFSPGFSTSKTGTTIHPDVHIGVHKRNPGVIHSTLVPLPWATPIQSLSPDNASVKYLPQVTKQDYTMISFKEKTCVSTR